MCASILVEARQEGIQDCALVRARMALGAKLRCECPNQHTERLKQIGCTGRVRSSGDYVTLRYPCLGATRWLAEMRLVRRRPRQHRPQAACMYSAPPPSARSWRTTSIALDRYTTVQRGNVVSKPSVDRRHKIGRNRIAAKRRNIHNTDASDVGRLRVPPKQGDSLTPSGAKDAFSDHRNLTLSAWRLTHGQKIEGEAGCLHPK